MLYIVLFSVVFLYGAKISLVTALNFSDRLIYYLQYKMLSMRLKSALFLIFQLVLKMYVFRCFVSMLHKYFSNAFFSKKICIYKSLIFSNLQKRIKKVLFFWSKNFVMSKIVRNFASSEIKNDIRTLTYLVMTHNAKVRKV